MAKLALVKCKYCGDSFSRENEEFEKIGNRYAHKLCYENHLSTLTKEEKDKEDFYQYLKELMGQYNYIIVNKLAEKYIKENGYTYSGMTKTLHYFYIIKGNPIEKANGSIAIIPYVYDEAKQYFYSIEKANKLNADKRIEKNMFATKVIHIASPQVKKKKKKFFNFLDKGE